MNLDFVPAQATRPMCTAISPLWACILVVEDIVTYHRVIRLQPKKLGCHVDIAAHGREAVDAAPAPPTISSP